MSFLKERGRSSGLGLVLSFIVSFSTVFWANASEAWGPVDTGVDVSTLPDWAVPLLVIGLLTTVTGRRRRALGMR